MDIRRLLIALVLSLGVVWGVQTLFPPAKESTKPTAADSAAKKSGAPAVSPPAPSGAAVTSATPPAGVATGVLTTNSLGATVSAAPETTVVAQRKDSGATFVLTNKGAVPISVVMNAYQNRARSDGKVDLAAGRPLFKYQVVTANKTTIDLSDKLFTVREKNANAVTYVTDVTDGTQTGEVELRYTFAPDGHLANVNGSVKNIQGAYLTVALPETFNVTELDTAGDLRALAYSYDSKRDGTRNVLFSSLDPSEKRLIEGPIRWVAAKSKYFVVGVLAPQNGGAFDELDLVGGARVAKTATQAQATVVVPIKNGAFNYQFYAGPQEWRRLHAVGQNFDQVNPYGWAIFRGLLQPVATTVIRVVLWMHRELHLSYGLVLIALGILVRILMWPLNQSAMRTSIRMQAVQPELQAIQAKYKDNPEKQRAELMKVYSEHGMTPLSPLTGCLPMLLPMPILLALFFVFQNTIEFRGVQFMWLNDLSAHDPFFILPVIMAASMYVLSWMGMRNSPPNPQAKVMSYMMPGMFLLFLGKAAAGLNLYYAAQNIAALPQQWMLTRKQAKERAAQAAAQQKKK